MHIGNSLEMAGLHMCLLTGLCLDPCKISERPEWAAHLPLGSAAWSKINLYSEIAPAANFFLVLFKVLQVIYKSLHGQRVQMI